MPNSQWFDITMTYFSLMGSAGYAPLLCLVARLPEAHGFQGYQSEGGVGTATWTSAQK